MRRILSVLFCVLLASLFTVAVYAQEATEDPGLPEATETVEPTLVPEETEPAEEATTEATVEVTPTGSAPEATPVATQTPEAEATEEIPAAEPTNVTIPSDLQAHYRIAYFIVDAPALTLEINGVPAETEALEFPSMGDWETVEAGSYQFSVDAGDTVITQFDATLEVGTWRTITLTGSADAGTVTATEIIEDYDELLPGTGGLTVFYGIEGDMMVNFNRNTTPYVTELTYPGVIRGGSSQLTIQDDAGVYDFQVVETQNPDNIISDLPQNEIQENAYTFIAVVGTEDAPQALVDVTDRSEVNIQLGELQEPGRLIEAAEADENLTTFARALEISGLAETLEGTGPYTIFAPANFVLDNADMSDPDALADILRYHIIEGKLLSRGVVSAQTLETLAGEPLTVRIEGNNIFVNDAQVIALNIPATNGVIHMINGVLTPPSGE